MARSGLDPDADPAPPYVKEYAARARELCTRGAGESDLAAAFGVSVWAIKLWRTVHEDFAKAVLIGREQADDRVTTALYDRCVGHYFEAVKPVVVPQGRGEPAAIEDYHYREYVPPDVGACRYWLNNRRPELWRERVENVVTSRSDPTEYTDSELMEIIRAGEAKAGPAPGGGGGTPPTNGQAGPGSIH